MNPHRLHYIDLQRPIGPPRRRRLDVGSLLALAIMFAFLGLYALHHLAALALPARPQAVATAPAFATPSMAVESARIEGFRAGMATALEQGCKPPVLDLPLTGR